MMLKRADQAIKRAFSEYKNHSPWESHHIIETNNFQMHRIEIDKKSKKWDSKVAYI